MSNGSRRKVLGRGLASLIPTHSEDGSGDGEIHHVDINAIDPNPYQPRVDFDEGEIAGLAESIKNSGLLQPVVLRQNGSRYEIVSGERRVRAFRSLRRDSVPCYVRGGVSDNEMLELALVENIQREQLNEIETAAAYRKLLDQCGYTHEDLAQKVGKSRAAVTNCLRLLNLPAEVQEMVRKGGISTSHARAILALDGEEAQLEAARRIVEDKLTVRDAEQIVQQKKAAGDGSEPPAPPKIKADGPPQDPNIAHQLEKLQYKFGTQVRLKTMGDGKGRLEINYFSEEDLVRIFDLLLEGVSIS